MLVDGLADGRVREPDVLQDGARDVHWEVPVDDVLDGLHGGLVVGHGQAGLGMILVLLFQHSFTSLSAFLNIVRALLGPSIRY